MLAKPLISRYTSKSEFATREGCYITELANTPDDESCSIALARIPPGVTTELHSLTGVTERYIVVNGEGHAEVDGVEAPIRRFDVVSIPAGVSQRITNTNGTDLLILCVCTPRFTADLYRLEIVPTP
jgi:mannose-6-phosphate isomerase-like protein (cupin superfamily)